MEAKRISLTIVEVCQKLGIDYCSDNFQYNQMIDDARRLGQIFMELKIIAGDLEAISEKHNIDGLKNIIHEDALKIDQINHSLIKLANQIRHENVD
jgi:hypothetical protein